MFGVELAEIVIKTCPKRLRNKFKGIVLTMLHLLVPE